MTLNLVELPTWWLNFNLVELSTWWTEFSTWWLLTLLNSLLETFSLAKLMNSWLLTSSWTLHTMEFVCGPLKYQTELFTQWLDCSWSNTLNLAKCSNRATSLLGYLNHALITCSWFLQYNSIVFDPNFFSITQKLFYFD